MRILAGTPHTQDPRAMNAVVVANEVVERTINTVGRCATLAKELSESEAIMELMQHKFYSAHIAIQQDATKWLTEARQLRFAIEGEHRGIAKTMADVADYFNRADVKHAAAQLRDLCDVVERVSKLNADPATQKLIEALMARA